MPRNILFGAFYFRYIQSRVEKRDALVLFSKKAV